MLARSFQKFLQWHLYLQFLQDSKYPLGCWTSLKRFLTVNKCYHCQSSLVLVYLGSCLLFAEFYAMRMRLASNSAM